MTDTMRTIFNADLRTFQEMVSEEHKFGEISLAFMEARKKKLAEHESTLLSEISFICVGILGVRVSSLFVDVSKIKEEKDRILVANTGFNVSFINQQQKNYLMSYYKIKQEDVWQQIS